MFFFSLQDICPKVKAILVKQLDEVFFVEEFQDIEAISSLSNIISTMQIHIFQNPNRR